jgi:hypothetical protein
LGLLSFSTSKILFVVLLPSIYTPLFISRMPCRDKGCLQKAGCNYRLTLTHAVLCL